MDSGIFISGPNIVRYTESETVDGQSVTPSLMNVPLVDQIYAEPSNMSALDTQDQYARCCRSCQCQEYSKCKVEMALLACILFHINTMEA